jgi:hypothetical protein
MHQINPAVIALGVGMLLALPKVGVLDTKALKSMNFLLVIFIGGALGTGAVLMGTKVLDLLIEGLLSWMGPLLNGAFHASIVLYWSNSFYNFFLGNKFTLIT